MAILAILASINKKWLIAGGFAIVIGLMGLRISWLNHKIEKLEGSAIKARAELSIAKDINKLNFAETLELQERLKECSIANRKLEADGEKAVTKLNKELENAQEDTKEALDSIKQALEGEECADVAVPSDVERQLRKAASRAG